jgi:flagellar protein FliS
MARRLLQAQLNDDERALDEVIDLISPVRDAWRQIRDTYLAAQGSAGTVA